MIEFASPGNYDEAVRIWTTCFGDTEQYTRFLFDRLLTSNNVLFHLNEAGHPDAMLCVKTFRLVTFEDSFEAAYVFGVATLPESRKRGIASALLDETHQWLSRRNVSLTALVPAGARLFEFYAKQGYETTFSVRRLICPASEIPQRTSTCILTPARLEELHESRRRHYAERRLFVDWEDDWLRYVDAEARALGGGTWTFGDEPGYVVCYPYRNLVIVKELTVPEARFDDVLAAIHEKFQASEYRFHLPEDFQTPLRSQVEPFAMVHWLDERYTTNDGAPSYMAHVLDGPTLGVSLLEVE